MGNKKIAPTAPAAGRPQAPLSIADKKKLLKKEANAVAQATIKKDSKNAMDDIFAGLSAPAPAAASSSTAAEGSIGKKRSREDGGDKKKGGDGKKKEKKDGLYKAPAAEDEFDMDDDMFFSRDGGRSVRRTEDGLRLLSEEELVRATNAGSKKAGTTVNCPFDCDCCF